MSQTLLQCVAHICLNYLCVKKTIETKNPKKLRKDIESPKDK